LLKLLKKKKLLFGQILGEREGGRKEVKEGRKEGREGNKGGKEGRK
jgi:hypothetical protein